jgi:GNAT superfamily N-acetyltransferase
VRVRADLRGRGVRAALLPWAVDEARRRGCGLVQLTTDTRRPEADHSHERLGLTASHVGSGCSSDPAQPARSATTWA